MQITDTKQWLLHRNADADYDCIINEMFIVVHF